MNIRRTKISPIAGGLIACLMLVVVALVVVALVNGVDLSGDLTYGDLLVGLGTFALAVLTAVLADATFGVDRRAAEREQRQQEREEGGIARLVDGELEAVQKSWETANGAGVWWASLQIPHGAWDSYAAILLQGERISAADGLDLIRFFDQLRAWETEVNIRSMDQIGPAVKVGASDPWENQFVALQQPLSNARRILDPLAYERFRRS